MKRLVYLFTIANIIASLVAVQPSNVYAQTTEASPSAQRGIRIQLPTRPFQNNNSPELTSTPTTQPSSQPTPTTRIPPSATPAATPSSTPAPTTPPTRTPNPTIEASASATPNVTATPRATSNPDEETIATAAGGLVLESPRPSPTASATPLPMPSSIPQIMGQVKEILEPETQRRAVENVKKSVNSVIKAPVETIARSLNVNPYDDKTLSYNTTMSLIFVALVLFITGIALAKPDVSQLFKWRGPRLRTSI